MLHVFAVATAAMPKQVVLTSEVSSLKPRSTLIHCRPFNLRCKLPPLRLHSPCLRSFPLACCVNGDSVGAKTGKELTGIVEIELQVRDYELDQYGVVNNAVYSSYIQHAHHRLLEEFGMDANAVAHKGLTLAVKDLHLKYISPLRSGDKFVIEVKVAHCSAARAYIEHSINKLPNLEPVVKAKSTVVWLDQKYRPVRVPRELVDKVTQLGLYENH